ADRVLHTHAARGGEHLRHLALEVALEPRRLAGGRRIVGEEPFGETGGAEGQALHRERAPVARQHELHAAAADVDQKMRAAFEPERVPSGPEHEPGLLDPADDPERDAGLPPDASHEGPAVAGLAYRTGRDGAQAVDAARARQAREMPDGADGEIHRALWEPPGRERSASEADHLADALHHHDPAVGTDVG